METETKEMETKEIESKRRRKRGVSAALKAAGLALLAAAVLLYLVFAFYYHQHFLPNTMVNGIYAGGMNAAEVEDLIADQVLGYHLTLVSNDGTIETIEGDAIGVRPAFHGELEELLKKQASILWPVALFKETELSVDTLLTYNEEALETELDGLQLLTPENQIPPGDAHISAYSENGFYVEEGAPGSTVDREKLENAVQDAVQTMRMSLALTEAGCYVTAEKTASDPGLLALAEEMNRYAAHTITLEMGEDSRTLSGDEIAALLTVGADGHASVDSEKVTAYVEALAEETDTYGKPHDFTTSSGTPITFQSVYYGWQIDREAEGEQLYQDLLSERDVSREPIYTYRAASHGEKDYGDNYVEVNISAQHMYVYRDGKLALDADCVTGNVSKGTITHVGLYSIYGKETERYLVGENYRSFVNYWMPFDAGEGLHDATWRSSFGGSTYLTSGSHGCVNLSKSVAAEVYDLVEVGTPVFVYRMDSTATTTEAQMASMAVSAINSIGGNVTLSSEAAISKAKNIYNYLSPENKGLVTNIGLLSGYEAQLSALKTQATAAQTAALEAAIAAQAAFYGNE